jgi:hypothetical protein
LPPIRTTHGASSGQFVIRNLAKATVLEISEVAFNGPDGDRFAVATFPTTLQPGGEGTVTFTFDPEGLAGSYSADCVIVSNDMDSPTFVQIDIVVSDPPVGANAYQQAVLDDEPLLYWTFDESDPIANAADKIWGLPANDLRPQGAAGRVASTLGLGNAADFDGVRGSRFMASTLQLGAASYAHYAIEMWIRLDQPLTPAYLLEGWNGTPSGTNAPAIIHGYNPNIEFFGGGGRTGSAGPAALADMDWHHVVMEVNVPANTHKFYIDGEPAGTFPGARAWLLPALAIGSPATTIDQPMKGQIDELALYNLAGGTLTGQDIAHHFESSVAIPDPILSVPSRIDLGAVALSPVPVNLSFQVTNLGASQPLNITGLSFDGPDGAAFTAGLLPAAIAPNGGTGMVNFTFEADSGPGVYSATATLASNDARGEAIVNLTVLVEDGPELGAPSRVDLPPIRTTQGAVGGQFSVRNLAKATVLEISEAAFSVESGDQFAVVAFPATLQPGEEGTITFTFDPEGVAGSYTADCVITSNDMGSPAVVQIDIVVSDPPVAANAYQQAVLGHGPLLYWTFDEEEPTANAVDKIWGLPANDLRPQGSAGRVASPLGLGHAADFDGVRGSRFMASTLQLGATSYAHYAIELWIRLGNPASRAYIFEGWNGTPAGTNAPAIIHGWNPNLEFFGGARTGSAGPAALLDMGWHHVVMEVNVPANTHSFYIDGEPAGTFAGSRAWLLPALAIGSPAVNTDEPMIGQVDELALYDLAGGTLTGQDLADHFQSVGGGEGPLPQLIVESYDPATSELRLNVGAVPPGRMFHLRGSTDLEVFTPLSPPVNFDSTTPQPLIIPTGGAPRFFVQVFEGVSP